MNNDEKRWLSATTCALAICRGVLIDVLDKRGNEIDLEIVQKAIEGTSNKNINQVVSLNFSLDWNDYLTREEIERISNEVESMADE